MLKTRDVARRRNSITAISDQREKLSNFQRHICNELEALLSLAQLEIVWLMQIVNCSNGNSMCIRNAVAMEV